MADPNKGSSVSAKKHSIGFQAEYEAAMRSGIRNPNVPNFIYEMYEKEQAEKAKQLEEKKRVEQERLKSLQKINRPVSKGQKKKTVFSSKPMLPSSSSAAPSTSSPAPLKATSTYEHWVNKDANWGYSRPEKKKKKKEDKFVTIMIGRKPYTLPADFSKPYTMSDSLRTRAFRILRQNGEISKDNGFYKKVFARKLREKKVMDEARRPRQAFAPPASLNFAPPTRYDSDPVSTSSMTSPPKPAEHEDSRPCGFVPPPRVYDDPSGEDAYQRRLRMSQQIGQQSTQSPSQAQSSFIPPPPPVMQTPHCSISMHISYSTNSYGVPPPPPPMGYPPSSSGPFGGIPGLSMPPPPPSTNPPSAGTVISAPPIRYNIDKLPTDSQDLQRALEEFEDDMLADLLADIEEEENQSGSRSNAPGQSGFARRYMESKGWREGEGLGAKRNGIKNAIRLVKAKRAAKKSMLAKGMGRIKGGD